MALNEESGPSLGTQASPPAGLLRMALCRNSAGADTCVPRLIIQCHGLFPNHIASAAMRDHSLVRIISVGGVPVGGKNLVGNVAGSLPLRLQRVARPGAVIVQYNAVPAPQPGICVPRTVRLFLQNGVFTLRKAIFSYNLAFTGCGRWIFTYNPAFLRVRLSFSLTICRYHLAED